VPGENITAISQGAARLIPCPLLFRKERLYQVGIKYSQVSIILVQAVPADPATIPLVIMEGSCHQCRFSIPRRGGDYHRPLPGYLAADALQAL
jgi:hypothetical protein